MIIAGILSHFIYEWSGHNKIIAIFVPVNESVWEHIKMVMAPGFIWMFLEVMFIGFTPNFLVAKATSMITMVSLVPVIFYFYFLIFKKEILILGILDFVFSVIVGQMVSYWILNSSFSFGNFEKYLSVLVLIVIFVFYVTKTVYPSKNLIFQDSITKKYGFNGHSHHHHKNEE